MKRLSFSLAGVLLCVAVCGCANTGTPEQKEAARVRRGKNIAKLERRAWSLGGFLVDLAGNLVVNTATNFVTEKLGAQSTKGFAK